MEKPVLKNEVEVKIVSLGQIEDNVADAKNYALELKKYYSNIIFDENEIKDAKYEKANVNKVKKEIADYRKDIVSEYKKPIDLFEKTSKETEKILTEVYDMINDQVVLYENAKKEKKKQELIEVFDDAIGLLKDVVVFDMVFSEKMLNETVSIEKATEEIINNIKSIDNDLNAIKELDSPFYTEVVNCYLQELSLGNAILKNKELKEQAEKLSVVSDAEKKVNEKKLEELKTTEVKNDDYDPIQEYTLKISGTHSQMVALREFLELNKMNFEKVG